MTSPNITFEENILTNANSNYAQNVTGSMILMSYLGRSSPITSLDGYVAGIQMMSSNNLKHYLQSEYIDKCYLRYAQNVTGNMILMSYSCRSSPITSSDGHVAGIQMMSSDKLKHYLQSKYIDKR